MPGFFLTLLAVLLAGAGGRDQWLVARLAGRFSGSWPLLLVAWLAVVLSTLMAVWAAVLVAPLMPARAKALMVILALVFAAAEILWRQRNGGRPQSRLREPTRSFFAALIVLVMGQIVDAPRFLVFALAMATGAPALAALGGVLAGGVTMSVAWGLGESALAHSTVAWLQRGVAGVFLLTALVIVLAAYGLI